MSWLTVMGSAIGIAMQIILAIQIFKEKITQNFTSWILWAILEGIITASIISQQGSFLLPATYSLGCVVVSVSIAIRLKIFLWTWFETMIACLAIACMIIWSLSGAWVATIASTSAVLIAGIPLAIDCYKHPRDNPFLIYSCFLIANVLATAGARSWSVEERLYPASCAAFTLLTIIFIGRKFFIKSRLGI